MSSESEPISRKRIAEFWEDVATKPVKYTEYELSDEHMRGLQIDHRMPQATPVKLAHFDAWLAEHDRRVKAALWQERNIMECSWEPNPYI